MAKAVVREPNQVGQTMTHDTESSLIRSMTRVIGRLFSMDTTSVVITSVIAFGSISGRDSVD